MKKILVLFVLALIISCSPKFDKDFSVKKNDKNYRMLISKYDGSKNDSISISWMISYQIENNTNRGIKFFRFRKRPEYLVQTGYMLSDESLKLFERLINVETSREIILYCTKKVSKNDFPVSNFKEEDGLVTFGDYHRNITKIPQEQVEFRKSAYFQNILKEVENDSIAIVFRDSVADDYFQFKGLVKDKTLKFSK